MNKEIYQLRITTIDGELTTLTPFKGKVILFVNVASRCKFTQQYKELEMLYQKFQEKEFVVLGFPCNQFLEQEPGDSQSIENFAQSCFRVTFPIFEKIKVKGHGQSRLYYYLENNIEKKPLIFVPWNFTKILVDANGNVKRQFLPFASFKNVEKAIEKLLPSSVVTA
jgi:glutathione peroxidase